MLNGKVMIIPGVPIINDSFYYDFMLFFQQILCFKPKALYIMLFLCHFRIKLCQFYAIKDMFINIKHIFEVLCKPILC